MILNTRRPGCRPAERGQAAVEHLLLTATVALALFAPLDGQAAPAVVLARALARFARSFVALMAWS
jgi:hypothetical protein